MSSLQYGEKTLYDLLFILCDMLSSENIAYHEEIICGFIKTIELEGKPLKPFIKVIIKHKHLWRTLEHTFRNLTYNTHERILAVMEETWPEDRDMIQRIRSIAYIFALDAKRNRSMTYVPEKVLIQNLLADT